MRMVPLLHLLEKYIHIFAQYILRILNPSLMMEQPHKVHDDKNTKWSRLYRLLHVFMQNPNVQKCLLVVKRRAAKRYQLYSIQTRVHFAHSYMHHQYTVLEIKMHWSVIISKFYLLDCLHTTISQFILSSLACLKFQEKFRLLLLHLKLLISRRSHGQATSKSKRSICFGKSKKFFAYEA